MDEVVLARRAAGEAVADIEPAALRERVTAVLDASAMLPGRLVVVCARSLDGQRELVVDERAAGVQLIYEGLRLTRSLAHAEPWADADRSDAIDEDANLDILVADVLVARGFYLLARTDAAEKAVETVRAFGRDQTHRRFASEDRVAFDRRLEADVFELAAIAGASAAGTTAPEPLRAAMADIGRGVDDRGGLDVDGILTNVVDVLEPGGAVPAGEVPRRSDVDPEPEPATDS